MKSNFYANILEGKENQGPVSGDPYFLQTKEEIENWLNKNGIYRGYSINKDLTVSVKSGVGLTSKKLTKIPVKFKTVSGIFDCRFNQLTSLKGCPDKVSSDFLCDHNNLLSLEYCPKEIGGSFYCENNELVSLEGCPKKINGDFKCHLNELETLIGCPEEVSETFDCGNNKLTSFKYMPKKIGEFIFMDSSYLTEKINKNHFKSTEFLTVFDDKIAKQLYSFPKLSWLPIKNILKNIPDYDSDFNKLINGYIDIIQDKNIDFDIIDVYYKGVEKAKKITKEFDDNGAEIFCNTILKDLQELQVY